ncbi:MAG: glycerol-3-phosphate acyltransferase [Ignavibacteria bacterium]|nr:glycerol-3-phosphate acyltransferase [Ignavibacteria bacterium]
MSIFWINYILICIIYYLIGAVPFAYLIVKFGFNKDVTEEGSGNVGTLNSFEITGSKSVGVYVFILDVLKGVVPSLLMVFLFKLPLLYAALPLILLVAGHNFSVWLKFKGGRGLATSVGIALVVNFFMVLIWCVTYYIFYRLSKKNIHIGNVAATALMPVFAILPGEFFLKFNYGYSQSPEFVSIFFAFWGAISLLILLKHIEPVLSLIKQREKNNSP